MSEGETKAIEEFREVRKKIEADEKYENLSTPLKTFLIFLSGLHLRDSNALQKVQLAGALNSISELSIVSLIFLHVPDFSIPNFKK